MAKKNETILNLLAQAPWWASVVLSVSAYIVLKFIIPGIAFENLVLKSFSRAAPQVAILVAFVLFIPGIVSAFNSLRKKKLLDNQKNIDTIRNLSWKMFEELVGEAYRRQGYQVVENQGLGPDGGIDLVLKKNGALYLVQCKQWRKAKVDVKTVREMYGLMMDKKATGVIIVTSGLFTQEAKNFVIDKPIDLVEGHQLTTLINNIQNAPVSRIYPAKEKVRKSQFPVCPLCGSDMVIRIAKTGKFAGNKFWGCSKFPNCKGIVSFKADALMS